MNKFAIPVAAAGLSLALLHWISLDLLAVLATTTMMVSVTALLVRYVAAMGGELFMDKQAFRYGTICLKIGAPACAVFMTAFIISVYL